MNAIQRNNVTIKGKGTPVMLFAHGFGCDQNMWRFVTPAFEEDYKVVLFDHVGAGNSDLSAYSTEKYSQLEGYAADIVEICEEMELKDIIFVGHSVSSLMGMIASLQSPDLFKTLIMISPSPSYINDGDYVGGFTREQITELMESLDNNHLGWSMTMAPVIMANPERGELGEELSNSFCRSNPDIAKEFARTTFFSDKRHLLPEVNLPTLILQCSEDVIAPEEVGIYMHEKIKDSQLVMMKATGHCPNLSAPEETIAAMKAFLK
ncbi:alpha/beta fold hydrolase [Kaistella jeonii]|uniref:Sigma factor sigB regulation protein rsbQ n=1 Tax=Kaistella jeonii TaxID=266749 RepID=A0A0C1FBN6_9FLAO|nr:alpha/beta hydrolase [Kaistella jeonii]KIA90507.1 sigma factor sigB regulation protein rsbQ [Kaistella jeonii]SFB71638.1 sigma-B regulation protein RsbQ [Kaistella jeonii]VEI94905.1 Sigma factor sigB regulation protein rsbQ [Kaistella jeonii]